VLAAWWRSLISRLAQFRKLTLLLVLCASPALACKGCGCKGGPGYRGPDGRCVGYAALDRVCGVPPETRCKREGAAQVEEPECSGCGCKGGPGYRGPDGNCVGYSNMRKICGDPPTRNCTAEGVNKTP
jgi:hypothetical protein